MSIILEQATEQQLRDRLAKLTAGVTRIKTIVICNDIDPIDPRAEHADNAGVLFCQHRGYLGDKGAEPPFKTVEMFDLGGYKVDADRLDEIAEMACEWFCGRVSDDDDYQLAADCYRFLSGLSGELDSKDERVLRDDVAICRPLYLYDHSGITMSVNKFSCPWDSGQVGWIYMTKGTLDSEFNGDEAWATKRLLSEVKIYDQYLTGDVYGFEVWEHEELDADGDPIDPTEGELLDSCWGFYGSDPFTNGISESIDEELHEQLRKTEITCR